MPILCEPGTTFDVILASDQAKDKPPTFICAAQSIRGQQKIARTLDKLADNQVSVDALFDETLSVLSGVVVGWQNMPKPFSQDALAEYLNYGECRELLRGVLYNSQVSPDQKKD